MNSEMEIYYAINKYFLSRIGGWPYQRKVLKVLLPCLIAMVHISVLVTQVLLLYDTWGDMNIVIECIITLIIPFVASLKLFNIVLNNDKFRQLLRHMNEHWKLLNSKSERHVLRYYASISQKITSYIAVYFTTTLIFYILIPLIPKLLDVVIPLNESRPLAYVYQAEYRVDKEKYYYPILFHSYLASTITMTILFTVDTTYIVCVLHTCSLFAAISQQLENITGETDITSNDDEKIHTEKHYHIFMEKHDSVGNDYHCLLITCLKKHQLALKHAQMLDSMFTGVTFIILSLNMLILSVVGIQLINNLENIEEVIRYASLTSAIFLHLICMCIPGQLLIDRSTEVFDKAYGSAWYIFSIKTQRLLRILLYRSSAPCTLTAGKMFVMSMVMCSSVMQTAMSYFTAFLSMR